MAKVLYIEDELNKNIATILKLFSSLLRVRTAKKRLGELESKDRVFPQDVVEACRDCKELDIHFNFVDALKQIINSHKDYDLILIDRNLSLIDYSDDFDEIIELLESVGVPCDEDKILEYYEREGDFLLLTLLRLDPESYLKTYYLTANTDRDLKCSKEIDAAITLKSFTEENIIEKGSSDENKIIAFLTDKERFLIQRDYRKQCNILRKYLQESDVNAFVELIIDYNKKNYRGFTKKLRKLIDNLLHSVAYEINNENASYWNEKNKTQLYSKTFIWKGLVEENQVLQFGYDSIIKNALISIFEICSDYGVHRLSEAIVKDVHNITGLTEHTLSSMLYQLLDVIEWYGEVIERIREKKIGL